MRNLFDGIDVAADLDLEVVQVGTETWLEKEIENFTALRLRIIEQQARHNLESTERQYNLRQKALELGWPNSRIQILDGDLGLSGAQSETRKDFQWLVAEVSMGKIGAVFALGVSRLAHDLPSLWNAPTTQARDRKEEDLICPIGRIGPIPDLNPKSEI